MIDGVALLVSHDEDLLRPLREALSALGIVSHSVDSYTEAKNVFLRQQSPALMFTTPNLGDATWIDVLKLAATAEPPIPAVLVARRIDYQLYMDSIDGGAADLIVPPFSCADLRCLLLNLLQTLRETSMLVSRSTAALLAADAVPPISLFPTMSRASVFR